MDNQKEKRVSRVREMKNDIILDAALKIFAEKGFHETRLEDIAQAAGFSKGSLYNYYKDKSMIFLSLGIREFTRLKERMNSDPLLCVKEELPFAENLRRMLTLIFTTFGDHFSFILTLNTFQFMEMMHNLKCSHSECTSELSLEEQFVSVRTSVDSFYQKVLQRAVDCGEISSPLSILQIDSLLDALILGTIREWKLNQQMGDIPSTVEMIVEFVSNGIATKK